MPGRDINKKVFAAAFLAACITSIVYLPALQNQFVNFDDYDFICRNTHIRHFDLNLIKWAFFDFFQGNWHPLTWLTFAADYAVWELNPFGYHMTNIILHSMNTSLVVVLIFLLMRYNSAKRPGEIYFSAEQTWVAAFITGLLFGIHPLHVESVAWISERKDVLCALFFLLSLIAYTRYAGSKSLRWYSFSIGFYVLSLLSKQMSVSLPFVLLILDWYPFKRFATENAKKVLADKIPFLALSIGTALLTYISHLSGKDVVTFRELPLSPRLLIASRSVIEYLRQMLWPSDLIPFYPYPGDIQKITISSPEYLIPILLTAAIAASCILLIKRNKTWTSAWSYYLITLLPVAGIIKTGNQAMADRYTYLPGIAPFFLFSIGLVWVISKSPALKKNSPMQKGIYSVMIIALLIPLSLLTTKQIAVWENSGTLWSRVIALEPSYAGAYDKRGRYYIEKGEHEKAFQDFSKGISIATDTSDIIDLYLDRSSLSFILKKYDKAIADSSVVIQYGARNWYPYFLRGKCHFMLKQYKKALPDFSEAIKHNPSKWELYRERAMTYKKLNLPAESSDDFLRARKLYRQTF